MLYPKIFSSFSRIGAFGLCSLLKVLLLFYKWAISPLLRPRCRFLPTCSDYALDALDHYGPYKGSILVAKRLCRCHPWGGHGFDPIRKDKQ